MFEGLCNRSILHKVAGQGRGFRNYTMKSGSATKCSDRIFRRYSGINPVAPHCCAPGFHFAPPVLHRSSPQAIILPIGGTVPSVTFWYSSQVSPAYVQMRPGLPVGRCEKTLWFIAFPARGTLCTEIAGFEVCAFFASPLRFGKMQSW